jgi:hypothetical protein
METPVGASGVEFNDLAGMVGFNRGIDALSPD